MRTFRFSLRIPIWRKDDGGTLAAQATVQVETEISSEWRCAAEDEIDAIEAIQRWLPVSPSDGPIGKSTFYRSVGAGFLISDCRTRRFGTSDSSEHAVMGLSA
jgi:hypothetical protein